MKLLAWRRPPAWALLIAGVLFVTLACYGLSTGEAYMPPGRNTPASHVLESKEPAQFLRLIRFQLGFAALLIVLGLACVTPVEDFFLGMQRRLSGRLQNDRAAAPIWTYAFLFVFIGFIVWIGRKVMYSE